MAHVVLNKHSSETNQENHEKLDDKLNNIKLTSVLENTNSNKEEEKHIKKSEQKSHKNSEFKESANSSQKPADTEKTKHKDSVQKEHKIVLHKEHRDSIHKEHKELLYKERKDSIHKEFKDSLHKERKGSIFKGSKEKECRNVIKRTSQDYGKRDESKVINDPKAKEIENKDNGELAACAKKISAKNLNNDDNVITDSDGDDGYKTPEDFEKDSETEDEYEEDLIIDEEHMKDIEKTMPTEEKKKRREEAQMYKTSGNEFFSKSLYLEAIKLYTKALQICPLCFANDRSILYSNRGACRAKLEENEEAIIDCSKALELNRTYVKPLLRRAQLYEALDKLDEALADYHKVVELDPSQHGARQACTRLPSQITERNEKLKQEMLSKLKDLGNMVLKPFGLSTNNFKVQQDPTTGSYSINFQQNPH